MREAICQVKGYFALTNQEIFCLWVFCIIKINYEEERNHQWIYFIFWMWNSQSTKRKVMAAYKIFWFSHVCFYLTFLASRWVRFFNFLFFWIFFLICLFVFLFFFFNFNFHFDRFRIALNTYKKCQAKKRTRTIHWIYSLPLRFANLSFCSLVIVVS